MNFPRQEDFTMFHQIRTYCLIPVATILLLSGCSSADRQARLDEFNRTIPTCRGVGECTAKWNAARAWVVANADFELRSNTDSRIDTLNSDSTRAGTAIQVDRVPVGDGSFQIVVDVECFAAYGCPNELDMAIEFNRAINATR
ncbi:MAG: hypothetical protein RL120_04740 [Gammaproteobacteria bacterium]